MLELSKVIRAVLEKLEHESFFVKPHSYECGCQAVQC